MHQLSVLETAVTTMVDRVVSLRGLLGALVRGLQSDSASRLGLATIATTSTPAPLIAPRATLVQSSNYAPKRPRIDTTISPIVVTAVSRTDS